MALIALSLLLYIKQLDKLYLKWNAAAWNNAGLQMVGLGQSYCGALGQTGFGLRS
jgi:hypothetical protein